MALQPNVAAARAGKQRRIAHREAIKTWRLAIRQSKAFNDAKRELGELIAKNPSLRGYIKAHRKALTLAGTSNDRQQRALDHAVAFLKDAPAHERKTIVERAVIAAYGKTKAYSEHEFRRPNLP
ncbi:MAG: hypothetical protein KC503_19380, partial [Myxococcales bacterium]|nr:hypothetical protein [Myxococcales bacterium]